MRGCAVLLVVCGLSAGESSSTSTSLESSADAVRLDDGRELTTQFVITALGVLSIPTLPHFDGMDDFSASRSQ